MPMMATVQRYLPNTSTGMMLFRAIHIFAVELLLGERRLATTKQQQLTPPPNGTITTTAATLSYLRGSVPGGAGSVSGCSRCGLTYPDLVRRIYNSGHIVSTHSPHHPLTFNRMGEQALGREVEGGIERRCRDRRSARSCAVLQHSRPLSQQNPRWVSRQQVARGVQCGRSRRRLVSRHHAEADCRNCDAVQAHYLRHVMSGHKPST
jgi:hypothetical protein